MKRWFLYATSRVAVAMAVLLALPAAGFAMPAGPAAGKPHAGARAAAGGITYAANAVVIPRSVVSAQLIGIAPGGVYKFKHAAGPLAQLKPGKVMVLEGSAAGVVTSVQTANHRLIVHTKDATVGQVIKSGTIKFDFAPDFHKAFAAPINVSDVGGSAAAVHPSAFRAPGYPYVPTARTTASGSLAIQGGQKAWGYSISGTVSGPGKIDLSGQVCLGYNGNECGNGPARAVAIEIGFSGTIDLNRISGDLRLENGAVNQVKAAFKSIKSQLKMNYTFSRGEDGVQAKFPPLHVPIGWDIPIPGQPVPLFVRVQFGALLQVLTKPAKNTVSHGAMSDTYQGSATAADSGGKAGNSGSGDSVSGEVNPGNKGLGISLANLGIDATFQEKAGLALGVSVANLMGFTDFTTTIGQEQASAIAGGFCSSYIGVLDWGVGLGAELGPSILGLQTQIRKSLIQKNYYYTEPGCKPISG
jgi:hypothetical protein